MKKRGLLLALSVLLALAGTSLVAAYVKGADERALAGQQAVTVLVAKDTIAAGTAAEQASRSGLITSLRVPMQAVPPGALTDLMGVGKKVATSEIVAGEMLLEARFADQQTVGVLAIPGTKIAVSVELNDPARVAGFVIPGSEVAVFNTYEAPAAPDDGTPAAATKEVTNLLLPRVTVIAVGTTTVRQPTKEQAAAQTADTEAVNTTVLTLAVTQQDAARLIQAVQTGKVYFGLLSPGSETGPSVPVDNTTPIVATTP